MINQSETELKKVAIRIPSWFEKKDSTLQGILYYLRKNKVDWQLDIPRSSDGELPEIVIDEEWKGDGIISFRFTKEEVAAFQRKNIKIVNVSSVTQPGLTTVTADNVQAGQVAAKHFTDLGLKNVVYVGRCNRQYSTDRWLGLKQVCDENEIDVHKVECDVNRLPANERAEYLTSMLSDFLPSLDFPIGLLASDDLLAGNIIYICQKLKIKIPQDIALIGVNNDPLYCLSLTPSLTSVDLPSTSIGYKAAEALNLLLEGNPAPETTKIPVEQIKLRISTNTLAYHDERTKKAIEFIRSKAPSTALKVIDVCKAIGISQSSLKALMAKTLGRSPKKEIDNIRISAFRDYLISTDQSIGEIAYSMGFHASEEASRFFRKMTGMTPTEFRKQHR